MASLQAQIKKKQAELLTKTKVDKRIKDLDQQLDKAYKRLDKLTKRLNKEQRDFEKLEGFSLKGLFYNVLGSKEEQKEKEKQEYLHATMSYEEVKKEIEVAEYEQKVLLEKSDKFSNIGQEVNQLIQQREKELISGKSAAGKRLRKLIKEIDQKQLQLHEIKEATKLGQKAAQQLKDITGLINRARSWGQWPQSRNRRMASHIRRTSIDQAYRMVPQVQLLLRHFESELRDVYKDVESFDFQIQLNNFTGFANLFFDNLISDWIVQQKIQGALGSVQTTRARVVRMLGFLEQSSQAIKSKLKKQQAERRKLVVSH